MQSGTGLLSSKLNRRLHLPSRIAERSWEALIGSVDVELVSVCALPCRRRELTQFSGSADPRGHHLRRTGDPPRRKTYV